MYLIARCAACAPGKAKPSLAEVRASAATALQLCMISRDITRCHICEGKRCNSAATLHDITWHHICDMTYHICDVVTVGVIHM